MPVRLGPRLQHEKILAPIIVVAAKSASAFANETTPLLG